MWYQHVETLSSPFFEGRAPGMRGGKLAADYVEFYFERCGLTPAFPSGKEKPGGTTQSAWTSYRQPFSFSSPSPTVQIREAEVAMDGAPLIRDEQYTVLGNSGSGAVTAPLTFVGYAIEQGPDGYSSFDPDTDLSGRIAVMLRYEPLDGEGLSRWSDERFSPQAGLNRKIRAVMSRNAAGVILVNPPGAVMGSEGLETLESSRRFGRSLDVPFIQLSPEVADALLVQADPRGRNLMAWRRMADEAQVTCVPLADDLRLSVITDVLVDDQLDTENVGGVLAGKGTLADKWIIIGGHYDHVGYGYTGTRPENVGRLHPGADDNASGTAGVLVLAQRLSEQYAAAGDDANLRSILFMAFGAEEAGLRGSRYYVEHPTIAAEDISAMINMDMIGRLRSESVSVGGTGTAEQFDEILTPRFLASGLTVNKSPGGRGPSDHASFYGAGIPVLFIFTGLHDRYHTPEDYGYTVNPLGAIEVLDLVEALAMDFASYPEQMTYVATSGSETRGSPMGSPVRLGVAPAYGAELDMGVLIDGVSEGTSAADAGIKKGDILIGWNEQELTDGARLMELLREHKPGDVVNVKIIRGDEQIVLPVTLKAREE